MSKAARSASAQRFAARARRRRLLGVLRALAAVLVLGAVGAGIWLVGWSPVLSVQNVDVVGVGEELSAEVMETAEVPKGTPLIRVDIDDAADRVRELPAVGDVEIRRSWPQTLTIDVVPREARAAIRDGRTWWSVDESGVLFSRSGSRPDGVPVLVAPADEGATLARATGVAVLTGLPSSIDEVVQSVEVDSAAKVRLILDSGATVVWGTAERADDKARALLALMERYDEPPTEYNVSAPDSPAVVP